MIELMLYNWFVMTHMTNELFIALMCLGCFAVLAATPWEDA